MYRLFILFLFCVSILFAQKNTPQEYRASAKKINLLIHTDLDIKPDFYKSYLYGKAIITLQPNFYPTDSLILDAKGMEIKEISILKDEKKTKLNYQYDSLHLFIKLDKIYTKTQPYTIFIDYIAKPNEIKQKGRDAITDAKGMYFINPLGKEKNKPTQIWTQGETESNSCWFPTIDKPNQKMTNRIKVTIPKKFVTLSNGLLEQQINHTDSTRTDIWYMDLPHAPYLVFLGIGEFSIVKDYYKEKEVAYYVEPSYEKVARKIFGNTPEMIGFYSTLLGVEFPWQKYAQMVGRDFVSGAMENTTATLHQETAQQSEQDLIDGNIWESTIAHELFHHWFGNLVTAESWSNITLNESFATYGSYLWNEYKYGKSKADETLLLNQKSYKKGGFISRQKDLVRYFYKNKEDVFDNVSYPKGATILHMLRKYLGDSAFFEAIKMYLTKNKFKAAEVSQLRLAFEEVSGEDL
ncbi:MAG: M1 family metallopeptidase, partial [Chitinophagaceae bacterium]